MSTVSISDNRVVSKPNCFYEVTQSPGPGNIAIEPLFPGPGNLTVIMKKDSIPGTRETGIEL